ncbi:MAG TPA: peptidylprolyl isomerase [Mycobacteriales bacterium]|nr:peptidylprolyl isomerase [Mycobacteriales bacterium]
MIRTARLRRALPAAALAAAVALLAGCGDGPVRGGAAALVGEERITTEQLTEIVDRGLEAPEAEQQFGADRADYQRQVLNRMVRALLLEEAAQEQGIEVTAGEVDEQLADFAEQAGGREALEEQAAAGGISPSDLPRFAREVVLELRLGDELTADEQVPQEQLQQLYESNRGRFETAESRHILVEDEAQARDLLAQVQADPSRFDELAAEFSTDTSNAEDGGSLGRQGRGTFVPEFDEAVFTQPVGEPFVVQTQFGWHVVVVDDRETVSFAEAQDELRRQALSEQRGAAVLEALRATAERVGVEVNPRFGQFDAEAVEVVPVPADDGLSSPAPEDGAVPAPPAGGEQVQPVEPSPAG